ncbi:MAG: hypothetical protein LV481_07440 [Methylacidiphilales bacterium]|nr:hypothetical protein [Candidatus Methylacidiphilales bacterium]
MNKPPEVPKSQSATSHPAQAFFEPVGKVVVLFNHLELILSIVTSGLCSSEFGAVMALMVEAAFKKKIDALTCVCEEKVLDKALKLRISALVRLLQKAEDCRNQIAHTVWMKSGDDVFGMKWSAKRSTGNDPRLRSGTMESIHKAVTAIESATTELVAISLCFNQMGLSRVSLSGKPGSKSTESTTLGLQDAGKSKTAKPLFRIAPPANR